MHTYLKKTHRNHVQSLKRFRFFMDLTEQELLFFIDQSYYECFRKDALLFYHGETAKHLYIVLEGWIKLYRVNKAGEEHVITLITKGDVFSELATFKDSSYPYSAQIVGKEAKCLVMDAQTVRNKIISNPELALKLLSTMARHSNQLNLTYEHITSMTAAQRIGCFLLKLSMDRNNAHVLQLPYKKHLIASRLGIKPETFSRALKRLNQEVHIHYSGREITVPDIDALKLYCDIECFDHDSCDLHKRLLCKNIQCDIYRILKLT